MSANVRIVGGDRNANSGGAANSLIVKANPGRLFTLIGYNGGPDQYIQIFDAATVPANDAVPLLTLQALGDTHFSADFSTGRKFENGIVVCNSTTPFKKTIGAVNCLFDATFN